MDDLDRNIIIELHNNCRVSFSSLAQTFGVTTATIMNRIDTIQDRNNLFSYRLSINLTAIAGKKFLIFFEPQKKFNYDLLERTIERYCLIDSYGVLVDSRYFLYIWCLPKHNIEQLGMFLESFIGIKNVELYMLDSEQCKKRSLTQMEVQIINHLVVNPRMRTKSIALLISRSTKGVRKAIKRLYESKLINFSLQLHSHTLMIKISLHQKNMVISFVCEWIKRKFPCVINTETSSKQRTVFFYLVLTKMRELSSIIEIIRAGPFVDISEIALCSPLKYTTIFQEMVSSF